MLSTFLHRLGQTRKSNVSSGMSAPGGKADIDFGRLEVCFLAISGSFHASTADDASRAASRPTPRWRGTVGTSRSNSPRWRFHGGCSRISYARSPFHGRIQRQHDALCHRCGRVVTASAGRLLLTERPSSRARMHVDVRSDAPREQRQTANLA